MTFSVTTLTVGRSTVRRALSSSASTASGADTGRSSRNEGVRRSSWARSGGFDGTVHHPTRLHHLLTMTGTVSQSTSTASPSPALRGEVRIHLQGSMSGPQFAALIVVASPPLGLSLTAGGSSTSSRASCPRGEPHHRTLRGARHSPHRSRPSWSLENHEGDEGVRRTSWTGTLHGRYQFTGIDATMIGTV